MNRLLTSFGATAVASLLLASAAFAQAPTPGQGVHANNIVLSSPGGNTLTLFVPTLSASKIFNFPDLPAGSTILATQGSQTLGGNLSIQGLTSPALNPFLSIGDNTHAGSVLLFDSNNHTITLRSIGNLTGTAGTNYNFAFPTPAAGILASDTSGNISIGPVSLENGGTGGDGTNIHKNYVFAAPVTARGPATYRQLDPADIPSLTASYIANTTTQQALADINIAGTITSGDTGEFTVATDGRVSSNLNFAPANGTYSAVTGTIATGTANNVNVIGVSGDASVTDDQAIGVLGNAHGVGTNIGGKFTATSLNAVAPTGINVSSNGDTLPVGASINATASNPSGSDAIGISVLSIADNSGGSAVSTGLRTVAQGGHTNLAIDAVGDIRQSSGTAFWKYGVTPAFGYLESSQTAYHILLDSGATATADYSVYFGTDHTGINGGGAKIFGVDQNGNAVLQHELGTAPGAQLNLVNNHSGLHQTWDVINGDVDANVTSAHFGIVDATSNFNALDITPGSGLVTVNSLTAGNAYGGATTGFTATVGAPSGGNGISAQVSTPTSIGLNVYNDGPGLNNPAITVNDDGANSNAVNFAVDWSGDVQAAGSIQATGAVQSASLQTGSITSTGLTVLSTESDIASGTAVIVSGAKTFSEVTGAPTGAVTVTVTAPAVNGQMLYLYNNTTGGFNLTLGTNTVTPGSTLALIYYGGSWH